MTSPAIGRQDLVLGLLTLGLAVAMLPIAFDEHPESRRVGQYGLAAAAVTLATIGVRVSRQIGRHDELPDVLAGRVPPDTIAQLGHAHVALAVRQEGDVIRVRCLVQNVMSGEGTFRLNFVPTGRRALRTAVPPLAVRLPPAAVVEATCTVPVPDLDAPHTARWRLAGSARGRGRRVRFARRRGLANRKHPFVATIVLLLTHHAPDPGLSVAADLTPVPPRPDRPPEEPWQSVVVWQPSAADALRLVQRTG